MDEKFLSYIYWAQESEDAAMVLQSDLQDGLSDKEALARLKAQGTNTIQKSKRFRRTKIFFRQFASPLIFILIIAGVVTFFMHEWLDTAVIFLAISVNAILGFYQENKAENALSHLRTYIQERTRVIRNGKELEIDSAQIVAGDLIHLTAGARVPADARLCKVNGLQVDEAILTGESSPAVKSTEELPVGAIVSERDNMVFGGTLVTSGGGMALVTATGVHTEIGKIASMVAQTRHEQTPLQKAVSHLAWLIALCVSLLVAAIFVLGIFRGIPLLEMFIMSVAIAVSAIPEALPIGLTAVLAVGVEQLAKKKGIIRNLSAAETLGSTTVIMTDKTGTLTEANMELVDIFTSAAITAPAHDAHDEGARQFSAAQKDVLSLAAINTDVLIENPDDDPSQWNMSGDSLEVNVVRTAAMLDIDIQKMRAEGAFRLSMRFNSKNKFSVSSGTLSLARAVAGKKKSAVRVIVGAPDVLLKRSKLALEDYLYALDQLETHSAEGKRLLGVAVQHVTKKESEEHISADADLASIADISFVGVLAFHDPIRKNVPQAIKKIEHFGVHVVMATGDLRGTAMSVAKELGWDISEGDVLTGEEIRQMHDKELFELLDRVRIFARVTPEDKLRLGRIYQQRGEVVAMTGDGVNDAPALKAMNIGIAVGSGSDVAKGVADLVLLDDNFEIIVSAIEAGKRMLQNIRKTFVYLMSNSFDEVILIGGSLLIGLPLPLSAIQIIWVNFVTESLPAIAYAFDATDKDDTLSHKDKNILNGEVKFLTLGIGVLTSALLFVLYLVLLHMEIEQEVIQSIIFACFSSYILFVAFSLRSLRRPLFSYNIFSNRLLLIGVGLGMFLLALTLYVPFLQGIFGTVALGPFWVCVVLLWAVMNIALVEFAKWLFYRKQ